MLTLSQKRTIKIFSLARSTNFVVIDEAHMSIAKSYKQVLDLMVNKDTILLGLTATPGRAKIGDEENTKLANFFFKQKATLKVKGYRISKFSSR